MKLGAVIAAILGLAVATWFVFHVGFAAVSNAIASAGLGGFVLLCLYGFVVFLVLGAAWFALMPRAGFWNFVWGRVVRDSAGEVLPFSQLGGILIGVRALVLRNVEAPAAFASSIVDVTTEMMAQIAFILIGIALFRTGLPATTVFGVGFVLAGSLLFIVMQRRGIVLAEKLAERFLPAVARQTRAFREAVQEIYEHPSRLALSSAVHLLGWIASAGGTWLSVRLMGGSLRFVDAIAIESVLCALRSAAIVVPGALGVQEAGYAMLMPLFGLSPGIGLAVSLLKRAREIAIGAPVLLIWQAVEGRRAFAATDA